MHSVGYTFTTTCTANFSSLVTKTLAANVGVMIVFSYKVVQKFYLGVYVLKNSHI